MLKLKLLVVGCLFSSMFCSAWLANGKVKREYVEYEPLTLDDSTESVTNINSPIEFLTEETNVFKKFKPREYVRVVTR